MIFRHALLLALLLALPVDDLAAKYSTTAQISAACSKPVPAVVSDRLRDYLQSSAGAVSSMPKVSCIAVLLVGGRTYATA